VSAVKVLTALGVIAGLAAAAGAGAATPKKLPTPTCKIYGMKFDRDAGTYTANGRCSYLKKVNGRWKRIAIRKPNWSYYELKVYDPGGGACPVKAAGKTNTFEVTVPGNAYDMSVTFRLWAVKTTKYRAAKRVERSFTNETGSPSTTHQCSLGG
jgi:hypothetical protein